MSDKRQPWMKFFPSDWRSEATLDTCSLAARGLWMEMLCIMSEAEPRGSLVRNGRLYSSENLAAVARCSVKEVNRLLQELEHEGVFSRDEDGTIYSRRMRRDVEKAVRDKANGLTGGNPNLNQSDKPPDKTGVNPLDKAQKPEARNPEISLREIRTREALAAFEAVRGLYPKREGHDPKKPARDKFVRIVVAGVPIAEIERGVRSYAVARRGQDPKFTKQLVVFLNQEGWRDEHSPPSPQARAGPASADGLEQARQALRDKANGRSHYQENGRGTSERDAGNGASHVGHAQSSRTSRDDEEWPGPQFDLTAERPH